MATVFTLEAMFAKKGDALLLHYGPWDDPRWIIIDGGPRGVYKKYVKPRLQQLRGEFEYADDESLPLRMVMVSHIDDDHIKGILDLVNEMVRAKEKKQPIPYNIDTLWHNSFDDILGNLKQEIVSRMAATVASNDPLGLPVPDMTSDSRAVVESTAQGRNLRNAVKKLNVNVNKPFQGLIMAPAAENISLGHGLTFTVIGPLKHRVVEYQKQWDKDVKNILKKEKKSAEAAAFKDDSPFNLASICVLARMKGKTILLTGDARGDYVIEGLRKADLLKTEPLHVDILKVPHHGSDRNVKTGFFEQVTADHYVISGDGQYGNPECKTLKMIECARGDDEYTIHFTFTDCAYKKEKNKERKAALKEVHDWVQQRPDNCEVVFRASDEEVYSVCVDLLDPLYDE